MSKRRIKLGTRGSKLALWQTHWAKSRLEQEFPELEVSVEVIRVESDRQPDIPITAMQSRGVFTRDIEVALLSGRIDGAVHSLKDLPSEDAEGLVIAATSRREDPRDALLTLDGRGLRELPPGATVGTSSLRRCSLLLESRPDVTVAPLRGNVDTRVRKLREGSYDAILMAAAALSRLEIQQPAQLLDSHAWVPAVTQGIIGIQARAGDQELVQMLSAISDPVSMLCASVEREFLRSLGGGCSVPVGGFAELQGGEVRMRGFAGSPDGRSVVRSEARAPQADAAGLGPAVAEELRQGGAQEILERLREQVPLLRE